MIRFVISVRTACWTKRCLTVMAGLIAIGWVGWYAALLVAPFPDDLYRGHLSALRITDREGKLLRIVRASNDNIVFPGAVASGGWSRLGQAAIAAEDKRFYRHDGVDGWAVARAVFQNLIRRRIHSGASTISTQVVRLRESVGPRGVAVKLKEAFRAMQLERRFSKEEVLSLYLDQAPFGGNLQGARAASLAYFDREPTDLSLTEAALLAGLPNAPSSLRPDRHPERARNRRDTVLRRMYACGFIRKAEWAAAVEEPVQCRPGGRSFEAPHFCDLLVRQLPTGGEWCSTLDPRIQALAEDGLRGHAERWRKRHVWGGAVVVLETATGAVRAFVGSPDYSDRIHAGQVNGAAALRSPGSALKPFLYMAAFDQGLATPETTVPDVPLAFGGYRPVNFDGAWRGMVSCRQALDQSLNIPAMWLCRRVGIPGVLEVLAKAGLTIQETGQPSPGLGLIIGDCRVKLLDLANAYAALARQGVWKPVRLLESAPVDRGRRIASPEACFLVADILSQDSRQMAFFGNCGEVVLPKVAWKTGTSSGFRDAWCVAWNPDFVVAVWIGNPDGGGVQGLTGQAAAVPVAAALFRRLVPDGTGHGFGTPPGLVQRRVCASSGKPDNPFCPVMITGWSIAGVSDPAFCDVHRRLPFFRTTGQSLPLEKASMDGVEWRVIEVWPEEVQDWLRRTQAPKAGASGTRVDGSLRIREPVAGRLYRRVEGLSGRSEEEGLTLRATGDGEAGELYWFVNGVFFKSILANHDGLLPWPASGTLSIRCADARGLSDAIEIQVE